VAAAQAAAEAADATLTVLPVDAAASQESQLREAVASSRFDGIIVRPPLGDSLVPAVEAAIARGVAVANVDRALGPDPTTSAAQVPGLAANVVSVPGEIGRKLGLLVLEACARDGSGPCEVGIILGTADLRYSAAIRGAIHAAVANEPDVAVVADLDGPATAADRLEAIRDMLTRRPRISVIVGPDVVITTALQAAEETGRIGRIAMIGYGGGAVAVQDVRSGLRFGTVMQLPGTEGRLAVEQLIEAIRSGRTTPGLDPAAALPDEGIVRIDDADDVVPEWPG
jgi:ribose transport system substrate-binding protein